MTAPNSPPSSRSRSPSGLAAWLAAVVSHTRSVACTTPSTPWIPVGLFPLRRGPPAVVLEDVT